MIALQRRQRDDDELVGALVLERLELGGQLLLDVGAEQLRVIDDAAGQLRIGRLGGRGRDEPQHQSEGETNRAEAPRHRGHFGCPRSAQKLELHLRHLGGFLGDGEVLHRLRIRIEHRAPPAAGDRPDLGIVGLHRGDVVAPRDGDAVLGAFELRLQREEVLVRLEVRIVLGDGEQLAERAGQRALRFLEFLEGLGIGEDVGRDLHLRRLGARLGHLGQHLALLRGVALHRLDEIGDEVGAALILVQHLAPGRLGLLLQRGDGVDAAAARAPRPRTAGKPRGQHCAKRRCVVANMMFASLEKHPKATWASDVLRRPTRSKDFRRMPAPPN